MQDTKFIIRIELNQNTEQNKYVKQTILSLQINPCTPPNLKKTIL